MTNPRNARQTSVGRLYEWRSPSSQIGDEPERFWSVTTLLKGGMPSPALTAWGMKAVAEYAVANHRTLSEMVKSVRLVKSGDEYRVISDPNAVQAAVDWLKGSPYRERDRKANIGSAVHEVAEAYVLGKPMPEPAAEIAPYVSSFQRFLTDFSPEYELAEATVYNRTAKYAGTLDAICVIPGRGKALIDYKTTGSGVYPETAMQLAAYRYAEFIGLPDGTELAVPEVDGCAVVWLRPDGYDLIPVVADDQVFRSFRVCVEMFRWQEELSKGVIGQPIPVPAREAVA